jgi:hypothetical protein
MDHLMRRVNARIGTPCRNDASCFATKSRDGAFYGLLHTGAILLMLPTVKACAIIFNNEFKARHQPNALP